MNNLRALLALLCLTVSLGAQCLSCDCSDAQRPQRGADSDTLRLYLTEALSTGPTAASVADAILTVMEARDMPDYFDLDTFDSSLGGRAAAEQHINALETVYSASRGSFSGAIPPGARPGQIFTDTDDGVTYQVKSDGATKTALWPLDGGPFSGIARIVEAGDLTSGRYVVDSTIDQIIIVNTGSTAAVIELPLIADAPSKRIWVIRGTVDVGVAVTVETNAADGISLPLFLGGSTSLPLDAFNESIVINAATPPSATGGGSVGGWFVEQFTGRSTEAFTTTASMSPFKQFARCDTTSAGFTVTVPGLGNSMFSSVRVKNTGTGGNTLTVGLASGTIDGLASITLADGESVEIAFEGVGLGYSF